MLSEIRGVTAWVGVDSRMNFQEMNRETGNRKGTCDTIEKTAYSVSPDDRQGKSYSKHVLTTMERGY